MIVRASPDWKVPTAARVQPPNAARSNFLEYELGRAYTMLNTNRFGRSKLERPHRCLGESWFPRVKAVPAPVPLMFAPSVSSAFENVYDARNCSPRLNCFGEAHLQAVVPGRSLRLQFLQSGGGDADDRNTQRNICDRVIRLPANRTTRRCIQCLV